MRLEFDLSLSVVDNRLHFFIETTWAAPAGGPTTLEWLRPPGKKKKKINTIKKTLKKIKTDLYKWRPVTFV